MRFDGLICLWLMTRPVVMPKKMHQRTSEQKQIGCGGKSYSQPKLRAEKTGECGHGDSGHRSSCRYSVVIVPSRDQVALRQIKRAGIRPSTHARRDEIRMGRDQRSAQASMRRVL